jgi:hypothetical protein
LEARCLLRWESTSLQSARLLGLHALRLLEAGLPEGLLLLSRERLLSHHWLLLEPLLSGEGLLEALLSGEGLLEALLSGEWLLEALLALLELLSGESLSCDASAGQPLLHAERLLSHHWLLLEPLLSGEGLLEPLLLADEGGRSALVRDLVGVDGWLDHALGEVLLGVFDDGHGSLAVDDGLNFVNHVGNHVLLHKSWSLHYTAHVRRRRLRDVLLDVMDNVLVDFAVDDGLHLNDAVLPDGLLHNGSIYDSHWLLLHGLLLHGDAGLGSKRLVDSRLRRLVLVVMGEFVQKPGHVLVCMKNISACANDENVLLARK